MYSVPLTTVPEAPVGVIVTLIVPVWPGLRTSGENGAVGLMDSSQRSLVDDVTSGSKGLVLTVIERVADPAGAGLPYGPHSSGVALRVPEHACRLSIS